MSTQPEGSSAKPGSGGAMAPQTQPGAGGGEALGPRTPRDLIIYGHSPLFYWWPVIVMGYLFALITYMSDSRSIIVTGEDYGKGVEAAKNANMEGRAILTPDVKAKKPERVAESSRLGVVFTMILLLVVLITNIQLRGLNSMIAVVLIICIVLLFALFGWWDDIFAALGQLSIHMNMGFYIFFSTVLLAAWLIVFFIYDRMSYWRITPGQIIHEYRLRGGEVAYNTEGMVFRKQREDLFRHVILGWGSGDLIMVPLVRSGTGDRDELQVFNVLRVGKRLTQIQALISEKPE
jgi:hypothetical protein